MKKWNVSFAIKGNGYAEVEAEAETEEEAHKKWEKAELSEQCTIDDWELHLSERDGGYLEIDEA